MRHPNPVTPLGQQSPQFAQQQRKPLEMLSQPRQEAGIQQIQQQVQELALEIYSRLVIEHLRGELDREYLNRSALHAQAAAKAYYESLGIQFHEKRESR